MALLDPGFELTLRPMKYPDFYEMYRAAIKNTWTVEEVDFASDVNDLRTKMGPAERHLIERLVAFFATGDTIVGNNVVLNLYRHLNSPEARMYLSRQLFEEALHVQFYLTLLDTYLPDPKARAEAFKAVDDVPSIRKKAKFCQKWLETTSGLDMLRTREDRKAFLLNLICFATCVEGMFFYGAFAYVYYLRSRGLLQGLASGTNWVFRDESAHMSFAFATIAKIRQEEPDLFDRDLDDDIRNMLDEAHGCEYEFAQDVLGGGVPGMSVEQMRQYLGYVADARLRQLGLQPVWHFKNPFAFLEQQDVQELTNFFERRPSAYQTAVEGQVSFDEDF
jgi:ribonucleoside-diphosphate reductase beta chain